MNNINKISFYLFAVIIFFTSFFNFFENVYTLNKSDINQRLTFYYGYCEKNSYGFIKFLEKKYKFTKNIQIKNDEDFPNSEGFIYKLKNKTDTNFLILLNYNEKNSEVDINNYSVIEKFKNCFLLKKND